MKCKYFYDGLCNIGKKCPYPSGGGGGGSGRKGPGSYPDNQAQGGSGGSGGTENSCPNFEEDNYLDNPDRERDISDNH
jgi:hypothetical protein